MTNPNASAFIEIALRDPELRTKLLSAAGQGDTATVEALAKDAGLPASFEEISTAFRNGSAEAGFSQLAETELSDTELEAVAGGRAKPFAASEL